MRMDLKIAGFVFLQSSVYFWEYPIIDLLATIHQSESTVDVRLRLPKSQPCYDGPIMACSQKGGVCSRVEKMYQWLSL